MKQFRVLKPALLRIATAFLIISTLSGSGSLVKRVRADTLRVAYVYGTDPTLTANAFKTLLTSAGATVDLYSDTEASLATTDFFPDQTIIIGDDMDVTGGFASFNHIQDSHKPVVAIGNWGLQFVTMAGLVMITAGTGTINASAYDVHIADPAAPVWSSPNPVSQILQTMSIFSLAVPVNAIGNPAPLVNVNRIGRLINDPNHYSLISDAIGARCYTYWGYRGTADQMTPSGENLFLNMVFGSPCTPGTRVVNSVRANTAPVMDGVLNYGEWSLTPNLLEMDHGFMAVMNDNIRLYLMVDVIESNINNTGANPNDFWVSFDTNNDGLITPGVDLNYQMVGNTQNMRYQHYLAPANWDFLSASTKSSLGPGFDCYTPDDTKVLNINNQQFNCAPHQLWEIAIDLKEINALPGGTIHMGLRTHTPNPDFADEVPTRFDVDFSNLITVNLAGFTIPPHNPNGNITFANPPFEITQVVQDVNNSIALVADKATAGRVSVDTTGVSTPQPVLEYLYGQRGLTGLDLPGSPLVQLINAPLTVDRGKLNDTANFMLPPSWIKEGEAIFHAEASDFNGHDIASSDQLLLFNHKAVPVYWIIQENTGTVNAPDLIGQSSIDSFESYVKAVFPVPDVTFVQKPWTVLGALNGMTLDNNVAAVAKYYNVISSIYWSAIMQNKQPPFALPDMIFGAANVGGGLSDPTWINNGGGHAAAGGFASSGEGVVAHEFNHDLDRTSNGTWGRHVNACGAVGPDPNWPNGTDPAIREYGFDTRLPWQNTNSSKTVVPTNFPDLMSYCTSGALPTKWISPYRYNSWIGSTSFPSMAALEPSTVPTPVDSLYIAGSLDVGGTGTLDPVLLAPGLPISLSPSGGYSVRVFYPGGPETHSFDISFQDVEGNPLNTVHIQFVLPDPGGVTSIQLLHGAQVLATISKSSAAPTASFTYPTTDVTFAGTQSVTWDVSDADTLLANLRQELEYSADNGDTWMPVAFNLPGTVTSYDLDTNLLPKSTQGRLRLWVTDGLNNITTDSTGAITVPDHAPLPDIIAPAADGFIPTGSQTLLVGQATDVDELSDLPDNNFLWTMDGSTTLGIGRSVQVVLPDGQHTLTLTVLDRDGETGQASVTVFVNQRRLALPLLIK